MGLNQKKSHKSKITKDGRIILSRSDRMKQRRRLWNSRPHVCCICGLGIGDFRNMELDHEIPRGMGGGFRDDSDENQQLTHCWCNWTKGSRRTTEAYKPVPPKPSPAVEREETT